jgi:hypothetical protein
VTKNNVNQAQFLSLLYPYTTTAATVTTTSTNNTAALAATDNGYKDIAFAQATNTTVTYPANPLPEAVKSDGLLTFYSVDAANAFAQLFTGQGTALDYGTTAMVRSTNRANISWQRTDITGFQGYEGYVSRDTKLTLAITGVPTSVEGNNIINFTHSAATGKLEINFSGPSNFRVITDIPLPVELVSFKAARQPASVKLTWQTATEAQNAGFAVLRKTAAETAFEEIGFVAGQGNSVQLHSYQFHDKTAPAGIIYYQLKQLDLNGKSHLSPVVAVAALKGAQARLVVAPVPAHQQLQVSLTGASGEMRLRLWASDGKIIREQKFHQQLTLDVSAISAGIYYLQAVDLQGQEISPVKKIIISH